MSWVDENRKFHGVNHNTTVNYVFNARREFLENPDEYTRHYEPDQKWLMGHVVPEFQRPVVWSEDQMIRFIESAAMGFHIGTWTYNELDQSFSDVSPFQHRTSLWIIDGQQRLTALDRFFDDKFPVFGKFWSEIERPQKLSFLRGTHFSAYQTKISEEAELRRLYDRMNFGGVAHTEEQRAVPRP